MLTEGLRSAVRKWTICGPCTMSIPTDQDLPQDNSRSLCCILYMLKISAGLGHTWHVSHTELALGPYIHNADLLPREKPSLQLYAGTVP